MSQSHTQKRKCQICPRGQWDDTDISRLRVEDLSSCPASVINSFIRPSIRPVIQQVVLSACSVPGSGCTVIKADGNPALLELAF